jgi:hypothetical protein
MEEQIPKFDGEEWIKTKEDADEVSFERADHALGNITTMHVRWHFLMCTIPFIGDVGDVSCTGLIVKDSEFYSDTTDLEALHDIIVSWDVLRIGPWMELEPTGCASMM